MTYILKILLSPILFLCIAIAKVADFFMWMIISPPSRRYAYAQPGQRAGMVNRILVGENEYLHKRLREQDYEYQKREMGLEAKYRRRIVDLENELRRRPRR
jgi:hypothetical protein